MDKTFQYTQVVSNFDSAYNIPPKPIPRSITYIPMPSSTAYASYSKRSSSPLFHRSISPPPRPPILLTGTVPKFNFDLYKMNENDNEYTGYCSPPHRSMSPLSSRKIHHYPIDSPISSHVSEPRTVSKLRQINDELCRVLARSELTDPSSSSPPPPHYHIHHYPLSQHSHPKYRSRSTSEERPSSTEIIEVSPKIHKARVTYKVHIPSRHLHQKSSRRMSTSDGYSSDEPVTIDLYPTRDQGFVKQTRQHSDKQSPWLVDGKSLRRNSYSDTKTSRTPKGPYYGDKPIQSYRRSNHDKERPSSSTRHQSPHANSRIRPDSVPLHASDQYHDSNGSFSNHTPAWRSNGSRAPPRIDSPSTKTRERVWHPPSKTISERSPKYFESTLKPENDETESEPVSERKPLSNRTKIRTSDPKLKKRIENTESKIKSTWQPTVTGLTQSAVKESKPSDTIPVKNTTSSTPPKSKDKSITSEPTAPTKRVDTGPPTTTNTGRSSLNDIPTKPMHESTPNHQNNTHKNDDSDGDLSENESPRLPIEKTPTPQQPPKSSTELPKTTVPEPDKDTKSTIKNDVLVRGNDIHNRSPTPSPIFDVNKNEEKTSNIHDAQPKSNNKNNESAIDDEDDEEVARSFDINRWLNDASKAILGPSKPGALNIRSTPPPPPPQPPTVKPKAKSPPRRQEQSSSPPPDENLYKPPFGPKKTVPKPSSSPPPPTIKTTTGQTDELDDFFD